MSTIAVGRMTAEEFLELLDDDMDRELIRGEIRESPVTVRDRFHSKCLMEMGRHLGNWAAARHERDFVLVGGEAGFRLPTRQDSIVGVDVAVVRTDVYSSQTDISTLIEGAPVLAVEILSPSDTHEAVFDKTQLYREAGVPLIWIVDPDERTVKVHRQGLPPELFHEGQSLSGDPGLPGFTVCVKELFECL